MMSELHVLAQDVFKQLDEKGRKFWLNGMFGKYVKQIIVETLTNETNPCKVELIEDAITEMCEACEA